MKKRILMFILTLVFCFGGMSVYAQGNAQDIAVVSGNSDSVAGFVERLYKLILQREADTEGLNSWVNVLKSGQESGAKVSQGFVDSNEFKSRNLSNSDYIAILYRTFLDREPDSSGLNAWLKVMDDGISRMRVFKGFVESDEFTRICSDYGIVRGNVTLTAPLDQNEGVTKFIVRCYRLCLGREADESGLNAWCTQILSGANTAKQAAYGFVFSAEFKSQNLSDTDFVKTMYRVFMDREADSAGLASWEKVLSQGQSRWHVFNGFADSVEFQKICNNYGVVSGSGTVVGSEEEQNTQKPNDETSSGNGVSTGKKNALKRALSYLEVSAFSREGLIDQLMYEKFSTEEATYAADNCGADWNKQALKKALSYLDVSAFSYKGLVEQLEFEKFTHEQAVYGADNCGADWNEQAAKKAESYLEFSGFSRDRLIDQLEFEGFTHEQAVYGVEKNGY